MTPKEAAIAVEKMLKDAGYVLGDLTFSEAVGGRVAKYDFSDEIVSTFSFKDGTAGVHAAPVDMRDSAKP